MELHGKLYGNRGLIGQFTFTHSGSRARIQLETGTDVHEKVLTSTPDPFAKAFEGSERLFVGHSDGVVDFEEMQRRGMGLHRYLKARGVTMLIE